MSKKVGIALLALAALAVTGIVASVPSAGTADEPPPTYVGSEACGTCHKAQYTTFQDTGHPWKLQTPAEAQAHGLPVPSGYTWNDIYLVIGGFRWKSRYIGQDGYIITKTQDADGNWIGGKNQYNLATKRWVDYSAGQTKQYSCGKCHTTGYSTTGNQDGKPGIVGTWALKGVQCERCHGPGSNHVSDPLNVKPVVDRSSELCGTCHSRGNDMSKLPAKNGYIEHHEQYQEILRSAKTTSAGMTCVSCHNPHVTSTSPVGTKPCALCHTDKVVQQAKTTHFLNGVTCASCHLAPAGKSAEAVANRGDVKTHLFRINTDPSFYTAPSGSTEAGNALDVGFACLGCHSAKDRNWASENATGYHAE
ncbi:MAG: cytochrome c3 family protein [Acidobacteria bacterium]|nr:cytochrome c3 family protein [Acidobacteriota bacterium]